MIVPVNVCVLNMRGQPLMPTTPRKARILLKENKVKVIRRLPFTIQLLYATGETKQDIILGIDAGYSFIGFSAVTSDRELLSGELELRKDLSQKITERKQYRRTRRNRLWYRKPRFDNRKASKPKGWLAPSILHKLESHIRLVTFIKKLLPIKQIIVEIASFDIHKMQKPAIQSIEYQQGTLFGYTVRNYLLQKWGHRCVYCGKKGIPLQVEHIIPKVRGGSNRIDNLTIACQKCNQKKDDKMPKECSLKFQQKIATIQKRAIKSFKAATFMNIVRWKLVEKLKCEYTYGDQTKYDRIKLQLPKSHVNDAFAIASLGDKENREQKRKRTRKRSHPFIVTQTKRNNRSIQTNRKGFKPSIRKKRYHYQPNDLVRLNDQLYRVKGMFNYGKWVRLISLKGKMINSAIKKIQLVTYGKGLCFNFCFGFANSSPT